MKRNTIGPFRLLKLRAATPLLAVFLTHGVLAQDLLPDSGEPRAAKSWRLVGANSQRVMGAHQGMGALEVQGNGRDSSYWRTEPLDLKPQSLYRLSFDARKERAEGGVAMAGLSRVNRDFIPADSWNRFGYVFETPTDGSNDFVRLGQWHLSGKLLFREPKLAPVMAVHRRLAPGAELGEGESVQGGIYHFEPHFGWAGANYNRTLFLNRAGFNTDRWLFQDRSEVIYRLGPGGRAQTRARVQVSIGYYARGSLRIDASRDGAGWVPVTVLDGQHRGGWSEVPDRLFPADEIFIRLACAGTNANLRVNSFEYESTLDHPFPDADGATHFMEVLQSNPQLSLFLNDVRASGLNGQWVLECTATNRTRSPLRVSAGLGLDSTPTKAESARTIAPNASAVFRLTCPEGDPGEHQLAVQLKDDSGHVLFLGAVPVSISFLGDRRAGYRLPGTPDLRLWWCESGWKVGREQPVPPMPQTNGPRPINVSAARGEYEAVQVVLNPAKDCQLLAAQLGSLRDSRREAVAISAEIAEVAYVHVTRPTDPTCRTGWYPDPLPPLRLPIRLDAGKNQPLWITFHVPRENQAGDFKGELSLETTAGTLTAPVVVHVYNFALPEEPHLRSAIGLSSGNINRYQHLATPSEEQKVYDKYLDDFARHRLSPYSFFDYNPIKVRFLGEGTTLHAQVDFSRFDEAAKYWLDQRHFTSLRLPLDGMPSGTFQGRATGELAGFKQGTLEYARLFREYAGLLERHLSERGWLNKAFAYWFDEPQPKDYDFVVEGMKQLQEAAPQIKRLLTTTPDPKLIGHVDIWCGLSYRWTTEELQERRSAGDEVWWYICTVPKAPYLTEFIDHPGTELRLWPWQSWQYRVSGILIWNATYWNSATAYGEDKVQDPWQDPMSYVSDSDLPAGSVGMWGNGDGRFLYPPRQSQTTNSSPCLSGPVDSIRWEALRDGMEDYEYFWLLRRAIQDGIASWMDANLLYQAAQLLVVPDDVSKDLTHFTTDPRSILDHRDRIARMIEQLTETNQHNR